MSIAFLSPNLLWALAILPALWLILRAVPPAPVTKRFPAVVLLLGLTDRNHTAHRTPWWLMLLRAVAVGAAIVGFAGPVMNPASTAANTQPLLIVFDGGWTAARDWQQLRAAAVIAAQSAGQDGQSVAIIRLTDAPSAPIFQTADAVMAGLGAIAPDAWRPNDFARWVTLLPKSPFQTLWISDGLDYPGRDVMLNTLQAAGRTSVLLAPRPTIALRPATFADGKITLTAARVAVTKPAEIVVIARGPDPGGVDRELARAPLRFAPGQANAQTDFALPPELRNRITRFEIAGQDTAGAISLTDDSLKRRKVAIISGAAAAEGLQLLSQTHYLTQALAPMADIIEGELLQVLTAKPDVIILADVAKLGQGEADATLEWVQNGGLLLRFAGPRMAANYSGSDSLEPDPLLPVRLRAGGSASGGAMMWGEAKALAPFAADSPFAGLNIGEEVTVMQQVLAEPGPDLAKATLAMLADGTPLVTRRAVGSGQIMLFHVAANAEWSTLPLSRLFVQMLERIAVSSGMQTGAQADFAGGVWMVEKLLDGFGALQDGTARTAIKGADLAAAFMDGPTGAVPPGMYQNGARKAALNVMGADTELSAFQWPNGTVFQTLDAPIPQQFKGALLGIAALLLALDVLATSWLTGRIWGVVFILMALNGAPDTATAQDISAIRATSGVVLAHVMTGDTDVDRIAEAGLDGLGQRLAARTSIVPDAPIGINLDTDELAFFPFIYWPVIADAPLPSAAVFAKLNSFLRTGGMIMFDTRDGDFGSNSAPESQALQLIASGLDIPPLEPIPEDHVLTRSFYLLNDFPGRAWGGTTWVEASAAPDVAAVGMPFRNLNDGVSPVIIGGNDWAAAWAVNIDGTPMLPVGSGAAGEQQREYAYRFGINVIMHVLTGNYKSDQVHVPALLDRLGQ